MNKFWLLLIAAFMVTSCGGPADEVTEDTDYAGSDYDDSDYEEESYKEDGEEGVFDPMVGSMDRARGVEDMGMDRKDEMDAAIDGTE